MQAMMQQAQKMQKEIMKTKGEIDQKLYNSKQSLVEVEMRGNKEITKIKIGGIKMKEKKSFWVAFLHFRIIFDTS